MTTEQAIVCFARNPNQVIGFIYFIYGINILDQTTRKY